MLTHPDDEGIEGNHRVVIQSQALRQSRYAGAPDIIGRTITINSEPYVVVG
jgi:hypothetical protein